MAGKLAIPVCADENLTLKLKLALESELEEESTS